MTQNNMQNNAITKERTMTTSERYAHLATNIRSIRESLMAPNANVNGVLSQLKDEMEKDVKDARLFNAPFSSWFNDIAGTIDSVMVRHDNTRQDVANMLDRLVQAIDDAVATAKEKEQEVGAFRNFFQACADNAEQFVGIVDIKELFGPIFNPTA